MVETLGVGQDNVVFLGRRSFRMEAVERAAEDGMAVPRPSSEIPTEKIFDSDRDRAAREVLARLGSREGISNTTLVTLCSTTFILGIALTLMVSGRPEPRRAMIEAAPSAPASTVVVAPIPAPPAAGPAEPVVVSLPPPPPIPAMRRPPLAARPARAVRPRPVRAVQSAAPAPAPWVDPFAE